MKLHFLHYTIIGLSLLFLIRLIQYQLDLFKWKSAHVNFSYQYYELKNYKKLASKLRDNDPFFYDYAQKLVSLSKWEEADSILTNKVIQRRVTSQLLILRGDIKLCLKDTTQAIENYKLASFIVPNSLTSKFKLMKVHLALKDTLEGYRWANSIVQGRVKIRSPTSDSIQKDALYFLTILKK